MIARHLPLGIALLKVDASSLPYLDVENLVLAPEVGHSVALLGLAAGSKKLANVRPNGQEDTPQFRIDIDAAKATSLGLSIDQINGTLAAAWGSSYIDDFVDRGRVKRVFVQADQPFRMVPEDFDLWSVKNDKGEISPMAVKVGDRVLFGKYSGQTVKVDGDELLVMKEEDLFAVVE